MPGDEQFFFARQVLKMQIVEFTERFRVPDRPPAQREFERIVPKYGECGGGAQGTGGGATVQQRRSRCRGKTREGRRAGGTREGRREPGGREGGKEDIGSISYSRISGKRNSRQNFFEFF